jgi:hypothetical protein
VFNFFFLWNEKKGEKEKKFLSPLSSFHFYLFFTHPSSFGGFVSQREEKRKFGERDKRKKR